MKQIFPAVFESVWKRKETKIFLGFTLFPVLFLIASFFGGSNFMQINIVDGYKVSGIDFLDMMMNSVDSLILPTLAIYFLTTSVFKREIEDHTMFLYRDIKRKDIFLSKYLSLIAVLTIYFLIFTITSSAVHYIRVVHLPFGTASFFTDTFSDTIQILLTILGHYLKYIFSITVAMLVCLYARTGTTMLVGVIVTITMMLTAVIGGPVAMVFPNGYNQIASKGSQGVLIALIGSIGITVIYSLIMLKVGSKKFKNLEF